jgi:hypothetical protein
MVADVLDRARPMHIILSGDLASFALGRSRSELHAANGAPERSSRQLPSDPWPVDRWKDNAIQVSYREAEGMARAAFIEVHADSALRPVVHDLAVFDMTVSSLLAAFERATGVAPVVYESGTLFVFHGLDIGLWRPIAEEGGSGRFKSIGIAVPGYYDFLRG